MSRSETEATRVHAGRSISKAASSWPAANLTNTPHFLSPASNVNSSSFMQVTSAEQDQRQFRFDLRLEF